ncbi:MAG: hypothetical protein H6719_34245 [Sandaracinaceae bacterium]|nr:hypothetical protein [Sandaracinaceae bacterium]
MDGERAIVSGMNIADEYARIGSDPALIWRDQDVLLEGPVVRDIESAFSENFGYFESIQARRPAPLASDSYWRAWRHVHPELRDASPRRSVKIARGAVTRSALRRRRSPAPTDRDDRPRRRPRAVHPEPASGSASAGSSKHTVTRGGGARPAW